MAYPETTFYGIFTAAGTGTQTLISSRFYPFNNVPQGASTPRGHYELDKTHGHHLDGADGLVACESTVQWVASTYDGALALADAARNLADGYHSTTVKSLTLESESPVFSGFDEGAEQGLFVVQQIWKMWVAESTPTFT